MSQKTHREHARKLASYGIADLARAFNHCHNPAIEYRYSHAVQRRFAELAAELVTLVETGEIVTRSGANAQGDQVFQALMTSVVGSARSAA